MVRAIRTSAIVGVLLVLGCPAVGAVAGDVSVLVGRNSLTEDRLDDAGVGSPMELGVLVNLDFQWPVMLAVDLLGASEDEVQSIPAEFPVAVGTDVDTLDLHVGARYFFRKETSVRPYVGGGLAWTTLDVKQVESGSFGPGTEFTNTVVDDGDSGVGLWAGGGLLYRRAHWQLGGDVRYVDASVDVKPEGTTESLELDAGGLHLGVFVGWSW